MAKIQESVRSATVPAPSFAQAGEPPKAAASQAGGDFLIFDLRPKSRDPHQGNGSFIVTAAADAGLVDVHARRPAVFSADVAREWPDRQRPLMLLTSSLITRPSLPTHSSTSLSATRSTRLAMTGRR
jgi:putative SOS response-associated peptidase YedK